MNITAIARGDRWQRRQALAVLGGSLSAWALGHPISTWGQGSLSSGSPKGFKGLNVGSELSWKTWRDQTLPLYQQAGVQWLRVWYNWAALEPQPGDYQETAVREALMLAQAQGFRILFVVWGTPPHAGEGSLGAVPETQAFRRYCLWLQSRLGPWVDAWEIGNEPNLNKYFSGSLSDYVQTLAQAYAVFQGTAPVVAAGLSGAAQPREWQNLINQGVENHCDVVNLHPYRRQPGQVIALIDDFLPRVRKPVWITELGLASDDGGEDTKADFLNRVYPLVQQRVEKLFWYRGIQGKGLHPLRFGLLAADQKARTIQPLPAYTVFAQQSS